MKAFTKFCLILSGTLFLVGLVGIVAGIAMGVRPDQLMDLAHYPGLSNKKPDIIEEMENSLDSLEDQIDSSLADIGSGSESGAGSGASNEYFECSNISRLNFDLSFCTLQFHIHDKDIIAVEAKNTGSTYRFEQKDDELFLKDDRKASTKQDSLEHALKLDIYVPEQTFEQIAVSLGTGELSLGQLSAKVIEIESGTGSLKAEDLSGENMNIYLGLGDLKIDSAAASEEADIETGTGNLVIKQFSGNALTLSTGLGEITLDQYDGCDLNISGGMGDVKVTAVGRPTDYNYELSCGIGEIQVDQHHTENSHHEGLGNYLSRNHNADRDMDISLGGAGSLRLNFTEED